MPDAALLDTLTDEQREAVTSTDRYVHVSAPPGSGKTRTMAARVMWLLQRGNDPDEICCLTFTRAAAAEIRERVERSVPCHVDRLQISTFHERALLDGPQLHDQKVATEIEQDEAVRSLYKGPTARPARDLPGRKKLADAIQRFEAMGWFADSSDFTTQDERAIALVAERLRVAGLVAMWELVPNLFVAQKEDKVRTYAHVLVDEAQDCTPAEIEVARMLQHPGEGSLCAVGDPRQAIMGWRGAASDGWDAPTHALTQTFRFGEVIAQASNALGVGPSVTGCDSVQSQVIDTDLDRLALFLEDGVETAILVRTHADAEAVCEIVPGRLTHIRRDPLDALSTPADRIAEAAASGKVPILTVHAAKGREWDRVIVIGPSTSTWGIASESEEEHRVQYVAMTRARKELVRAHGDRPEGSWWRIQSNPFRDLVEGPW